MNLTSTIAPRSFSIRLTPYVEQHGSRDPLRIWHVGASASPNSVNGVNVAIWRIAAAQAAAGHDVHLPVLADLVDARLGAMEVTRHVVPVGRLGFDRHSLHHLLAAASPDIVHIHSAFIPRHTLLGRFLRKEDIPYVLTPHGGLLPQVLHRDRVKKLTYSLLLEKPYVRSAAGVTGVTPNELDYVRAFAEPASVHGRYILNPVSPNLEEIRWTPGSERPIILFLGRFDAVTKGLDRLIEIARHMPEADFHLYGRSHSNRDDALLRSAPANVALHAPVYGADKNNVLRTATLYLQPSRWEAFSISVAEALAAGLPCALTETLHQAKLLAAEGAAFPISENPAHAAVMLKQLLGDSTSLLGLSVRGRDFAHEHLAADGIARAYVEFYRELLGRRIPAPGGQRPVSGASGCGQLRCHHNMSMLGN